MQPLAALERFFERLIERPTARLFGAHLQPVQLLRRVERAMETERRATAEGTFVPDRITVRLNPVDLDRIGTDGPRLADALADGALHFARAHGYRLRGRPRVTLVRDAHVDRGDVAVHVASTTADGRSRGGDHDPASDPHAVAVVDAAMLVDDGTMVYRPPAVLGPVARLRVLDPTGADRAVLLDGAVITIGRGPDNTVVLGDPRVSRQHARLHGRQGTLVLVDLGSSNGTFVNGVAIQEVALGIGDEIRIGDTRLLIEPLTA